MHNLADLAAFHYQGGLDPFLYGYKVMVDGAHGQKGRYCRVFCVKPAVREDYIVDAVVNRALCRVAEGVQGLAEPLFSL